MVLDDTIKAEILEQFRVELRIDAEHIWRVKRQWMKHGLLKA